MSTARVPALANTLLPICQGNDERSNGRGNRGHKSGRKIDESTKIPRRPGNASSQSEGSTEMMDRLGVRHENKHQKDKGHENKRWKGNMCQLETRRTIAMGKDAFCKRKELIRGKLNKNLKKQIMIWSVVLYGSETCSLRKEDIRRLGAFEMWIWHGMERMS